MLDLISSAAWLALDSFVAVRTVVRPWLASILAISLPIPREAPVTMATVSLVHHFSSNSGCEDIVIDL